MEMINQENVKEEKKENEREEYTVISNTYVKQKEKVDQVSKNLDKIIRRNQHLVFKQLPESQQRTILIIGEIGNGKSTLANYIIYQYIQKIGKVYKKKEHKFASKKSLQSVTKEVSQKKIENITVIDTPGFNDTDENLTNANISEQVVNYLKNEFIKKEGISTVIHPLLVGKSMRIQQQSVQVMADYLLSLCYFYTDFDIKSCPRICVFFTDFDENSELFSSTGSQQDQVQIKHLMQQYIEVLIQCVVEQFGQSNTGLIRQRIDILFKQDNFQSFQLKQQKQEFQIELQKLDKFLEYTQQHGQFVSINTTNQKEEVLLPIQFDIGTRDIIIRNIKNTLEFYIQLFSKIPSSKNENKNIWDNITKFQEIKKELDIIFDKFPYLFQKMTSEEIKEFNMNIRDCFETFMPCFYEIISLLKEKQVQPIYDEVVNFQKKNEKNMVELGLFEQKDAVEKESEQNLDILIQSNVQQQYGFMEYLKQQIMKFVNIITKKFVKSYEIQDGYVVVDDEEQEQQSEE